MNFITGLNSTASALQAEKTRMDVVSQNIANAHTTRDVNGEAYKRKVVSFESALDASTGGTGVRVSKITDDSTPGELVRNPQHPHADKDGMVQMPNVNTSMEMVDLISASRAYEANLSVARNARQMATKALSIGR
ncbi:flagellar basal-body rod protein FlgC [Verrucomicrobiota bacterium]|jgi:flagellar basal-body rod protein FlgC|nr:flagellar basal-body rod protein FlgC [Verrucomicrobiota bacterium]